MVKLHLALAISGFTFISVGAVTAQTIGYAEAFDHVAVACGADIDKYCKKTNLGGGRVQQCLSENQGVSATCKKTIVDLKVQLQKRAAARVAVMRVCEKDILRLCNGIERGDGNLLECFFKVRRNTSAPCQKAVIDAGYDVSIGGTPSAGQVKLDSNDVVNALQGVETSTAVISAASLRQLAAQGIRDPSRANRVNRAPLSEQLGTLAQFTMAIQFDFNSARIRPDSSGRSG